MSKNLENLLHQGDAISFLNALPSASASLTYIDPPWGVGDDSYAVDDEDGAKRLRELYLKVAVLCHEILNESGVIVWHTNPTQQSFLRNLLDEVFGAEYFHQEIILKRPISHVASPLARENHSTFIIYAKGGQFCYTGPTQPPDLKHYNKVDKTGRPYRLMSLLSPVSRPSLSFEWHGIKPPEGKSWRHPKDKLDDLAAKGLIEFSRSGIANLRRYHDDVKVPVGSVWEDIPLSKEERAYRYSGQQPLGAIRRLLGAYCKTGDSIVDPFVGSGTTLVAAAEMGLNWVASELTPEGINITKDRLLKNCSIEVAPADAILEKKRELDKLILEKAPSFAPSVNSTLSLAMSPETSNLEFKQTLSWCLKSDKKEKYIEQAVLKTIGAFLNTDGGTLLVGVADDNSIPGVDEEISKFFKNSSDNFMLHYQNLLQNHISAGFFTHIKDALTQVSGKTVLRVDVTPANEACFIGKGKDEKYYVRRNPRTTELTGRALLEYIETRKEKVTGNRV